MYLLKTPLFSGFAGITKCQSASKKKGGGRKKEKRKKRLPQVNLVPS